MLSFIFRTDVHERFHTRYFCFSSGGLSASMVGMQEKQLLIFGASGRTGAVLAREAQAQGFSCHCPTHAELPLEDLSELEAAILSRPKLAGVINCAAISGLEACLDDAFAAHCANALAPAQMALACRHTGARFIHLSTDYVLDGRRQGLKDESSKCRPCCTYAMSKWEGEQQVSEANDNAIIARVSWVCGNPVKPSFVEQTCAKALQAEPLAAIADKFSMPTNAADIARACLCMLTCPQARGIVHLCSSCEQPLSWWDCAQIALQELHRLGLINAIPTVEQQRLAEVSFFRDERPRHTAMMNTRLTQQWGIAMPRAQEAIAEAVKTYCESAHP